MPSRWHSVYRWTRCWMYTRQTYQTSTTSASIPTASLYLCTTLLYLDLSELFVHDDTETVPVLLLLVPTQYVNSEWHVKGKLIQMNQKCVESTLSRIEWWVAWPHLNHGQIDYTMVRNWTNPLWFQWEKWNVISWWPDPATITITWMRGRRGSMPTREQIIWGFTIEILGYLVGYGRAQHPHDMYIILKLRVCSPRISGTFWVRQHWDAAFASPIGATAVCEAGMI